MFVTKLFHILRAHISKSNVFYGEIFNIFLYEDEDIGRFSNLHKCTSKCPLLNL